MGGLNKNARVRTLRKASRSLSSFHPENIIADKREIEDSPQIAFGNFFYPQNVRCHANVMVIGILIKEKEREESRYNEKRCFK